MDGKLGGSAKTRCGQGRDLGNEEERGFGLTL